MEALKNKRVLNGIIVFITVCAYILLFIFFNFFMGRGVATIAIFPVMVLGFLYGTQGGMLVGIFSCRVFTLKVQRDYHRAMEHVMKRTSPYGDYFDI